jgi:hypothetical protein
MMGQFLLVDQTPRLLTNNLYLVKLASFIIELANTPRNESKIGG